MSIEFNFGWLNDYTGSRFAPFTVANCVLMDTSSGSTETLFDYISLMRVSQKKNFDFLKNYAYDHERKFRQILSKQPTFKNPENGKIENLSKLAVQSAGKLIGSDSSQIGADGEILNNGIDMGDQSLPVYFTEGVPKRCYSKGNTKTTLSFAEVWAAQDMDFPEENPEGKILSQTDGGGSQWLEVDIGGVAAYANQSNYSYIADAAKFAGKAKISEKAVNLTYDVEFGRKLKDGNLTPDSETYGDIVGTIPFKNPNAVHESSEIMPVELNLTELLSSVNTQGYGQAYKQGTIKGTMYIPSFKLDKKGRITEIQDYQYNVNLKLDKMSDRSDISTAYLVTVNAPAGDNPNYVYSQGASTEKSIYIEWGSGVSEPILMGAAWNDYAEYRAQKEEIAAGYCVKSNDDGKVELTTERLSICDGIVSDTFGFSIGKSGAYQTPLAVSGRVLAYCEGETQDYHAGDVVCASENGKVSKMTREEIREYPDRIVGTVSEIPSYEKWNDKEVNGRIWIKVK